MAEKSKDLSCNLELNIKDIKENCLLTIDGYVMCYIKIYPVNLFLLSKKEIDTLINQLASELSGETKPFKFFSIARGIEVTELIDNLREIQNNTDNQISKMLLRQQITELLKLALMGDRVERQVYFIIWDKHNEYAQKDMSKRCLDIQNKFANCNIKTEVLNEEKVIQLCNSFVNSNYAYKEDADYEDCIPLIKEGE